MLDLNCLDAYPPDGTPRLRLPASKNYFERAVQITAEAADTIRALQALRSERVDRGNQVARVRSPVVNPVTAIRRCHGDAPIQLADKSPQPVPLLRGTEDVPHDRSCAWQVVFWANLLGAIAIRARDWVRSATRGLERLAETRSHRLTHSVRA